jgi:hypothetical protein
MRLYKQATTAALIAAASVAAILALAPAGALAYRHPSPNGRCEVGLEVLPPRITVGESIAAQGQLRCLPYRSAAGRIVRLYQHAYGTGGYTLAQTTTTQANGVYKFTSITGVTDNSVFYVSSHGAQSGRRRVRVEVAVTLSGPPPGTQILTGFPNKQEFTGTVSPEDASARVILQRQNALTGNEWHAINRAVLVNAEGKFTIPHTFVVPGDANLRVLVRSRGRYAPSLSNELSYEISQAQNPHLTITASPDPIAFGQSVSISGVAEDVTNQPMTLLLVSRKVHQHGYTPVAETTTSSTGAYTFPAQAPENSTFYEVRASGKAPAGALRSAVLFEGVQDVLTASVSPSTTIQAGLPLTFSGTVLPLPPEPHVVYLERQNASRPGFHVVQVGVVNADSPTYSLTYTIYDPGTHVYRVRIPGGPDNEGAVSQPFTITVTPSPASILRPEAPGNSSLPSEGSERGGETPEAGAEDEAPGRGTGSPGSAGGPGNAEGPGSAGNPGNTGSPGSPEAPGTPAGGHHKGHHGRYKGHHGRH